MVEILQVAILNEFGGDIFFYLNTCFLVLDLQDGIENKKNNICMK